eukprot:gene8675-6098_t
MTDNSWYKPHPYGVYPRGNARDVSDIVDRFGIMSGLVRIRSYKQEDEHAELAYLDVIQNMLSFLEVPDLCRLSSTCTGWYVMVHCTDAFKNAFTALSPTYMDFHGSWKETAIRAYLASGGAAGAGASPGSKRSRCAEDRVAAVRPHQPVAVKRAYYCDQLFQAWMCTILPPDYHMRKIILNPDEKPPNAAPNVQHYTSAFKPVDRRQGLTPEAFMEEYEAKRIPVIMTDIVRKWPMYKILQRDFMNLARKKEALTLPGRANAPLRCEFTEMNIEDYVRYAKEQTDERPIYMFDAEFGSVFDTEKLYTVPPHFAQDDLFSLLGKDRPKYRWIISGPARGGSGFHVDPNYTHAWNANLTGRKRWLFFPPSCPPPGVVPSCDMSEVATPVSLMEWVWNNYQDSVQQLRHVGYECVCEPGDIIFVPCGWWHSVINLEDSVAVTQNYVSRTNLSDVLKFLRAMKTSISGINEDLDCVSEEETNARRAGLGAQFAHVMHQKHPELMRQVEEQQRKEREERFFQKDTEGFTFDF